MTPDGEARVLRALEALKSEMLDGFKEIKRELRDVGLETGRNTQRLDDLRCAEHEVEMRAIREGHANDYGKIKEEVMQLRISDVSQDGNIKLKFSMSSLLLQLLIGILAMIPVGLGAFIAIQKALAHLQNGN